MKRKWIRAALAVLCALFLCAAACPALAEPAALSLAGFVDYAMVSGTSSLNLREGPSAESNWLGSAPEGAWVGIRGESGNWYYVCVLDSGLYGYMSKNYLTRGEEGGAAPGSTTGVVTNPKAGQFLNLRQYPSYDAPVLGIFYNGATFSLLSSTADGWYQVLIAGQTGYFRKEFVTLNGGGGSGGTVRYITSANGGKVNLRNAPTYTGSSVLRQLPVGTQVQVLLSWNAKGAFWKVRADGQVGYVDSSFLTSTPSGGGGGGGGGTKPSTSGTAVVNNPKATQVLNLREQPSTSAKVIAQYHNGFKFQVIAPGETWTKVYGAASGNIGYFMTKYLKLSGGATVTPTKTVSNNGSYVNLRTSPSKTAGNVSVQVPSGAVVTVLIPGDEWTQVRYKGTVGYMMTFFLK